MKTNLAKDAAFDPAFDADATARAAALPKDISLIGHVQVSMAAQVGTVTMSVDPVFGRVVGRGAQLVTVHTSGRLLDAG